MTREEADFIGGMNMRDEISNEAYKKIMCHCEEQEPCYDCISFPKGALKMRGEGYVVYNYDWFKENWQIELKILGIDWKKRMQEPILDKIRAEIEEYKSRQLTLAIGVDDLEKGKQVVIEYILAIIDKYKAESEDKE